MYSHFSFCIFAPINLKHFISITVFPSMRVSYINTLSLKIFQKFHRLLFHSDTSTWNISVMFVFDALLNKNILLSFLLFKQWCYSHDLNSKLFRGHRAVYNNQWLRYVFERCAYMYLFSKHFIIPFENCTYCFTNYNKQNYSNINKVHTVILFN